MTAGHHPSTGDPHPAWMSRSTFVLTGFPLLLAAVLIIATFGAADLAPYDALHDVAATVGGVLLIASAIRPRVMALRLLGAAGAGAAIIGRLTWWLALSDESPPGSTAYALAVLLFMLASTVLWAWSATFLAVQQQLRRRGE